jgi:ribonuclease HII
VNRSRVENSTGRDRSNSGAKKTAQRAPSPTRRFELGLYREGVDLIAGVDEVGRGCLAGPVLAAAVILPSSPYKLRTIVGVKDSKVLKVEERERLYGQILKIAVAAGVGLASHSFIDRYGIAPASRVAMAKAVGRLGIAPNHLLIDALRLPLINCNQTAIIDGDALCLSIAAASIIAKVTRDRLMGYAGLKYPGYGFESHKGYGTPEHHRGLVELGPCAIHRLTFRPAFASCTIAELGLLCARGQAFPPRVPVTVGVTKPPVEADPPTLAAGY